MIPAALRMTVLALRAHWGTLTLLVVCVHWPLDVLESYIIYNWMDPESLRANFKVARAIDQFLRVIPDAAIFHVVYCSLKGESVGLGSSLVEGLRNYGRMWITRFLVYLSFFTLLLLVVPGIYWLTRWIFAEASVIGEEKGGTSAFGRSWELTRGRFWSVFGAVLAGVLVYAAFIGLIVVAFSLAAGDTWWLDALSTMLCSLMWPIWLAYIYCLYQYLIAGTQDLEVGMSAQPAGLGELAV
jgi:hypothetical protein